MLEWQDEIKQVFIWAVSGAPGHALVGDFQALLWSQESGDRGGHFNYFGDRAGC